jgi:2'-5' RNA ligase
VSLRDVFRANWRDLRAAREQAAAYRRIWQAFRQYQRLADGRHDTPEWRSHEGVFAACIVRVPAKALQPGLDELRDALQRYDFVRLHPDRFLHVMLQELGFVRDRPVARDEIGADRLHEFATAAAATVSAAPSFDIRLGGANAFQDAVFLDVHDRGACARLHARLHELATIRTTSRFAYLPHATIAHFTTDAPLGNLPAVIARWRDWRFGTIIVNEIEIVTLRVDDAYPELEPYAVIPLGG